MDAPGGALLGGNEGLMTTAPWLVWAPGLAIVITVLSVNYVGDGLRDAFDVKVECVIKRPPIPKREVRRSAHTGRQRAAIPPLRPDCVLR